jgi:hypothetical protein
MTALGGNLVLDQDPSGRRVKQVESVFDIDDLNPAVVALLRNKGVSAPKTLQKGE